MTLYSVKKKSRFQLSLSPDVAVSRQVFKAAIINMFKEQREAITKDLMESVMKMNKLVVFKKEGDIIKRTKCKV